MWYCIYLSLQPPCCLYIIYISLKSSKWWGILASKSNQVCMIGWPSHEEIQLNNSPHRSKPFSPPPPFYESVLLLQQSWIRLWPDLFCGLPPRGRITRTSSSARSLSIHSEKIRSRKQTEKHHSPFISSRWGLCRRVSVHVIRPMGWGFFCLPTNLHWLASYDISFSFFMFVQTSFWSPFYIWEYRRVLLALQGQEQTLCPRVVHSFFLSFFFFSSAVLLLLCVRLSLFTIAALYEDSVKRRKRDFRSPPPPTDPAAVVSAPVLDVQ